MTTNKRVRRGPDAGPQTVEQEVSLRLYLEALRCGLVPHRGLEERVGTLTPSIGHPSLASIIYHSPCHAYVLGSARVPRPDPGIVSSTCLVELHKHRAWTHHSTTDLYIDYMDSRGSPQRPPLPPHSPTSSPLGRHFRLVIFSKRCEPAWVRAAKGTRACLLCQDYLSVSVKGYDSSWPVLAYRVIRICALLPCCFPKDIDSRHSRNIIVDAVKKVCLKQVQATGIAVEFIPRFLVVFVLGRGRRSSMS